jgi:hypothetical protein
MNVPPQSTPAGALRLTWHVRAFVSSSRVAARPRLDKALAQQARVEPRPVPGQVAPRRMAAGCTALRPLMRCIVRAKKLGPPFSLLVQERLLASPKLPRSAAPAPLPPAAPAAPVRYKSQALLRTVQYGSTVDHQSDADR